MAVDVAATANIAAVGPTTAGPVADPGHSDSHSVIMLVCVHGQPAGDDGP